MQTGVVWCAAVVACLVGACAGDSPDAPRTAPGAAQGPVASAAAPVADHAADHAGNKTADQTAGQRAAAAPVAPEETALRLEALVGQHAILAAEMMRARIRADADLAQAADAALGRNTRALGDALQPVIGARGRRAFEAAWSEHIESLFAYAQALATRNTGEREHAHEEIVEYETDLAEFFASGSNGRLSRSAALKGIHGHVDHLVEGADAYAAEDYEKAADLYRAAYSQTFDLGEALVRALVPADVATSLDAPQVRLQAALTKLLGEHVALVVAAMRSSTGDRAEFEATGAALNGNTLDLTAAFDSLFGEEAADGFQTRWADHIDQLMAYARATVMKDSAGQQQARAALRSFEQSLATFLDGATQNRLGRPALTQTLVMHDRMLMAQIDAHAADKHQQAHDLSYQAYEEMVGVSGQLSRAIGATVAKRLPRGGTQTGGGGMASAAEGG